MPKGYLIARAHVTNPEKWAAYADATKAALERFGGKPLVRGGRHEIVEGEGAARNAILEFPSFEDALGYARSPEYAAAKALREGAGIMNMTIVEGL
jgi:uncharacterized protein (DUF1330 family)